MAFTASKLISDLTDLVDRAVSAGWQAAIAFVIAQDVLHDLSYTAYIAAGLSVGLSLLVKLRASNAEVAKIENEVAPVVKDAVTVVKDVAPIVAPVVEAADPAAAPLVQAVEAAVTK